MGVDVEVPKVPSLVPLDIEIGWGPNFHNVVFEYKYQVIVSVGIRIVARQSDIHIDDNAEFTLPWALPEFELLDFGDRQQGQYRIGKLQLDGEQILNLSCNGACACKGVCP